MVTAHIAYVNIVLIKLLNTFNMFNDVLAEDVIFICHRSPLPSLVQSCY